MELAIARVLVAEPSWLPNHDETCLRWALSLARVSQVRVKQGEVVEIGHATDAYRENLYRLLEPCFEDGELKRRRVKAQIEKVRELAKAELDELLLLFGDRLPLKALMKAVRSRPLALTLGGGGGVAYVYLGAMSVLDEAGISPSLITGSSMGAIIGAFRARDAEYSLAGVKGLLERLSWRRVFRLFDTESRFGLPATLKLHLREVIGHEFERDGRFLRLKDLEVPLRVCVAGLTRGESDEELAEYEHLLDDAVADIKSFRKRAASIARTLTKITREPMRALYWGGDELTEEMDVLDAIGFSSAVPAVIHYDVLRDDPRMVSLCEEVRQREGVFRFIDGGLADNLPAREAWRAVQSGACKQYDPFVLALDGFAPRLTTRHLLFLPLMRIAAENSKPGRAAAHLTVEFRHVLSPLTVVPTPDEFHRAVRNGRAEFEPLVPLIRKMIGPIPDPPGIVTERDGS
jgi:predicted acylesterase/phospholipase RssA